MEAAHNADFCPFHVFFSNWEPNSFQLKLNRKLVFKLIQNELFRDYALFSKNYGSSITTYRYDADNSQISKCFFSETSQ